ncbi:MAG: hypothetical protein ABSG03_08090 [Bryobacteraceae bacterium]|jgi:hypothetical protein
MRIFRLGPANISIVLTPKWRLARPKVSYRYHFLSFGRGSPVEGQDSKEFVVPPQSAQTIYIEGIHWQQTLPLVPGGVKVRVIVRDEATGKAGTLTLPVGDPR